MAVSPQRPSSDQVAWSWGVPQDRAGAPSAVVAMLTHCAATSLGSPRVGAAFAPFGTDVFALYLARESSAAGQPVSAALVCGP